jgi:tetratricopeptide (TPR) repeat protein
MTLIDLLTRSWHRTLRGSIEVPLMMPSRAAAVSLLAAGLTLAACGSSRSPEQASSQLNFGVDMARRGLWHEALFRFEAAERLDPNNARIQSDIGVAYEAAGQFDKALSSYQKALKLDPNDKGIRTNYSRFVEFYQGYKGEKKTKPILPASTSTTHKAAPPAPRVHPGPSEPSTRGDAPPPPTDAQAPQDTPPDNRPPS